MLDRFKHKICSINPSEFIFFLSSLRNERMFYLCINYTIDLEIYLFKNWTRKNPIIKSIISLSKLTKVYFFINYSTEYVKSMFQER